ncbi:MAG TPA: hypothetical protein VFN61_04055 [Acidimicrobiales bacterium]|nr:hypothetical protein [Acidimicrobiales bacterium]
MAGGGTGTSDARRSVYIRRRLTVLAVLLGLIGAAAYVAVAKPTSGVSVASVPPSTTSGSSRRGATTAPGGRGIVASTSAATSAGRPVAAADPPTRALSGTAPAARKPLVPPARVFAVGTASMEATAQTPAGPATVPVAIYYPALRSAPDAVPDRAHGPYPLIVFSQGFGEYPSAYSILLDTWARAGYVVAAPTYTHTDPGPGLWRPDIVNHPAELSGTITAVLNDSATAGRILTGLVQRSEIAVAGQSDGGDVSLAAVANTCCRDSRIKAAVILSGAEYSVLGGAYFKAPNPPMLVTQGDHDSAYLGNAPVCSTNLYNAASAPKYYVDLFGATHLPPYTQANAWESVVAKTSVDFLNAYLRHESAAVGAMFRAGRVRGISAITSSARVPSAGGTC